MKNKYIIEYLDILVDLFKGNLRINYDKELFTPIVTPIGTFEEVKCVADFIRMFKGIDFQVEEEHYKGWDFKNSWITVTSTDKYRLKFIIHKEFFSLNDSNKIDAKYKEFKNWLKIKDIDNDFN